MHLLDIACKSGIPPLSFCYPVVTQIYKYDQANGTELLKTLTAYVYNGLSLQQTANVLYIHRNTLYHRITLLKDLFNIDFSSPRVCMKLWVSVTVYSYLNKVRVKELLGPMF